jgi:hypothetical protein
LPAPVRFNEIQLTFDTDTNRRVGLPLFRYPECVKKYVIAIPQGAGWTTLVETDSNYFRRRVHTVDAVTTNRVRIHILETNGSPHARIYEVRLYHREKNS